jgi:putative inorganic carbon (hco3(-)) transporter
MTPRATLSGPWPAVVAALLAGGGLVVGIAGGVNGVADDTYDVGLVIALLPVLVAIALWVEPSITLTVGLGLSMFSGNWEHLGDPIPLDRVMIATAVAAIAVRALSDPEYRPQVRAVHWVLVLASLYALGSALWVGTLDEHEPLFSLLDRLGLISFGLFFVAPVVFRTDRQRMHLLIGLVVIGAYLGFTALVEEINLDALVWPHYIRNPFIGLHADRARGPFVEAAANGLALFACAVAASMAASVWRGRARAFAIGIGVLCLAGVLFTVTRQAWLGASLGALVGVAVTRRLRPYALPLIAGGALIVFVGFAVVPGLQERAGQRAADKKPIWDRLNSDRAAVRMIEARPFFGFGWGTFSLESEPYYSQAATYPLTTVDSLHSVFLSNAVELGLVGALLWAAGLLMALAGALFRRGPPELDLWRDGLLAYAACWLVVSNFTPLGYSFSNYLLWIWAGLAGASVLPRRHGSTASSL